MLELEYIKKAIYIIYGRRGVVPTRDSTSLKKY